MIITATLIMVATIDSRIINLENDRCRLKAIRFAMNGATLNTVSLSFKNKRCQSIYALFFGNSLNA
jgi:hypothetical protein